MCDLYKAENKGQEFAFMHIFNKLEKCKIWEKVRYEHNHGKPFDVNAPADASAGRPEGHKKAKAARNAHDAEDEAEYKKLLADVKTSHAQRNDANEARWREVLDTAQQKTQIEAAKVNVAKVEVQASMIHAINAQMAEEANILSRDTSNLAVDIQLWYADRRAHILGASRAARASGTSAPTWPHQAAPAWTPPSAPASAPASASTEPAPAMTEPAATIIIDADAQPI